MEEIILFLFLADLLALAIGMIVQVAGGKRPSQDKFFLGPLAVAAIMGAIQLGVGAAQKAKAAKLARANKRPPLEDNPYTQTAYDLTGQRASQGLGGASIQAYQTANDRNLSSSINAILKSGGSANNIASLYEGSQTGLRTLTLADEEARMRNINQFLTGGLAPKADEDRDKWYLNRYVPFQDMAELASGLSKQGMDNISRGLNTVGGAAMAYKQDQDDKKKLPAPRTPQAWDPNRLNTAPSILPNVAMPTQPSQRFRRFNSPMNRWERFDPVSNDWIPDY